jgi:hypothetical protein
VSKTKTFLAALVCALAVPAAVIAKEPIGSTRVMFTPAPKGLRAGQVWRVRFWFYFQDGKPYRVSGLRPTVAIRNVATGASRVVGVSQDDSTYYSARIVFPARGTWTVTFRFDPLVPGGGTRRLTTLHIG